MTKIKLQVRRSVELDKLLLLNKPGRILERRQTEINLISQPQHNIDSFNTQGPPKSILRKPSGTDRPFSLCGRRRKSVTFDSRAAKQWNESMNPHPEIENLINFDNDSSVSMNSLQRSEPTLNVLEYIGFDGPQNDDVLQTIGEPIEPIVQIREETPCSSIMVNHGNDGEKSVVGARKPIPGLIPIKQFDEIFNMEPKPKKRRPSIAASLILNVCNSGQSAAHPGDININIDYNLDQHFGVLRFDESDSFVDFLQVVAERKSIN